MKIIEALKQRKDLIKKAEDLRGKIAAYCAHLSIEAPVYGTAQGEQVRGWLQAHQDIVKEMRRLSLCIQKTNLSVDVVIEIGGESHTMPIAGWILRRRELANMELSAWNALSDKNLKPGTVLSSDGKTPQAVTIVRYYDPVLKDSKTEQFRSEPSRIDARLEIVNATTDLVE